LPLFSKDREQALLLLHRIGQPFVDRVSDIIDQIDLQVTELRVIRDLLQPLDEPPPGDKESVDER
jgi:hypothetical protein